jgi:hypothetical protein
MNIKDILLMYKKKKKGKKGKNQVNPVILDKFENVKLLDKYIDFIKDISKIFLC